MSYKISIKQLIQDSNSNKTHLNKSQQFLSSRREGSQSKNIYNLKNTNQKLLKKRKNSEDIVSAIKSSHSHKIFCNLQSAIRYSNKQKGDQRGSERESPVKKLFKDLFHHTHTSFAKGSFISTPRGSASKKEGFNTYLNVQNVSLDRTYYFRKVLSSQKIATSEKNNYLSEKTMEPEELLRVKSKNKKTENEIDTMNTATTLEQTEAWGKTLNQMKSKLVSRTKNKYTGCQIKISRIDTENVGQTKMERKVSKR